MSLRAARVINGGCAEKGHGLPHQAAGLLVLVSSHGCACWTCEPRSRVVKTQGSHAIAALQHNPEGISYAQAAWN